VLAVVHERAGRLLAKRARPSSQPVRGFEKNNLEPRISELARAGEPGNAAPYDRDSRRYGRPPFRRDITSVFAAIESFLVAESEMRLAKTS